MATDTAAPPRTRRRNYWQLPTFAVGVAAAVAAWTAFPPTPASPADRYARDLAALKQTVEARSPDLDAIAGLAPTVAAGAESAADPTGAYLLAGTGFLLVAESRPAETEHWTAAADAFAKIDPTRFASPDESKRFTFRRAKALAALGQGDPPLLFLALATPPPGEELHGERHRLLADVALRREPPDLATAQKELVAYLGGRPRLPAPVLARYRLKLSEVSASLNDVEKARSYAKNLGPEVPAEVQAEASVLLGRLAAAENNWVEAVQQFEAALGTGKLPAEQAGVVRFQLGTTQLRLNNRVGAIPYFEQASAEAGPVGVAAAVRLAELILRDPALRGTRGKAIEYLAAAVRTPSVGSGVASPYVSVDEVRAVFEEAVTVCLGEGAFAEAVRAAELYTAVATPGRDREKRAEANAAWAAVLKANPATAAEATSRFRSAAADYAVRAAEYPTPEGRADFYHRALANYRQAGDEPAALAILDKLTGSTDLPAEAIAAAWVEKAEGLLTANQFDAGVAALQKALSSSGPAAARARVRLGLAHVAHGQELARKGGTETESKGLIEYGQRLLAQAATAVGESAVEKEAHQQALFELGKLLLQQGNLPEAEARFRKQVLAHPTGSLAEQGKLYLGSCLLVSARGDHQGGTPPVDADKRLAEAAGLFQSLSESKDAFLRTQADIRLANTVLLQKKYEDVVVLVDRLTARYAGKVQELVLLSMRYHAETFADRKADAARTLARMEKVFRGLSDADFPGGMEEYTRVYWRTQWFEPPGGRPKQ
jgi:tetratricopeptide (TPR) repeat protein